VALTYAVVSGLWIACSDTLVAHLAPTVHLAYLASMFKGWVFVLVTAALLYVERRAGERRAADQQQALAAAEARQRAVVSALPDLVAVVDADGTVRDCCVPAGFEGYRQPEEVIGRPVETALPTPLANAVRALLNGDPADAPVTELCFELPCREGTKPVEARLLRIDTGGAFLAVRDVTARLALEERLRQAAKMEAIGRLAGGVAHDFNNLLSAIMGNGELLQAELGPDHHARAEVDELLLAASRAAELTGQLLAFGGRQAPSLTVLDLTAVVGELRGRLRRLLPTGVELTVTTPEQPLWARATALGLQQVVVNLAVHARDAMPDGGPLTITLQRTADGEAAELAVTDTGDGLDESALAHIFEPFYSSQTAGGGAGLSLATVYATVLSFDGEIAVESAPGRGSTFRLRLPLCPTPPAAPATRRAAPVGGGELILLAEDEDAVRALTERALTRAGYRVVAAADCNQALVAAEALDRPLDLLLTDVVMPGRGGPELAAELSRRQPGLKVLLMSGYAPDDYLPAGEAEPDLLVKPFRLDDLLSRVRDALDHRAD
jgi:signal transduction histidine kinase